MRRYNIYGTSDFVTNLSNLQRAIVYIDEDYQEYCYIKPDLRTLRIYTNEMELLAAPVNYKKYVYNQKCDAYILRSKNNSSLVEAIADAYNTRRSWNYNIPKRYNLSKIPEDSYNNCPTYKKQLSSFLFQFTYGIEFETSNGRVPGKKCWDLGIVPLYDGSIRGYEYVTTVLRNDQVFSAIKSIISTLKEHTTFNADCSIHIHIGGFPITLSAITKLISSWQVFQYMILPYLPKNVYKTELWKNSGKSYCQPLNISDFISFFNLTTGNEYKNHDSFYLPNLNDIEEEHKWQVTGRYFNMNIMHLISGNSGKTIEFRFLLPTYNYAELELWIIVLSSFITYVKDVEYSVDNKRSLAIDSVLKEILPNDIYSKCMYKLSVLKTLRKLENNNDDPNGLNYAFKEEFLSKNTVFNDSIF